MVAQYLKVKHPGLDCTVDSKPELSTALHDYINNKLFHGKTVKGINTVLSVNTPTLHVTQPKLIMQLRWGMFVCFNLTLICSWHCKLNIWQCNYCIWFQRDMQPLSSLHALTSSFHRKDNVITSTVAVAVKFVSYEQAEVQHSERLAFESWTATNDSSMDSI